MTRAMLLRMLLLGLFSSSVTAGAIISVSDVKPLPLKDVGTVSSAIELFQQSCPEERSPEQGANVIASSYEGLSHDMAMPNGAIFPSSDSLVRGAIDAWGKHQHLILRPDVIWFEMLAQLNLYMSKHAEDVRHLFVNFQGKEEIVVREWTWQGVIDSFKTEIQSRVKTDWLLEWITPGFSTSTDNDNTTATVLMMGLMQQYFKFTGGIICGLPSVQLLGERQDWVNLLNKLERLREFGDEPAQFARNLQPILQRFVQSWDEPDSDEIQSFWKQIVRAQKVFSCGSGPFEYDVSGWITGFMHWTSNGKLRVNPATQPGGQETTLDGVVYYSVGLNQLPVGYAKAPIKLLDYPTLGTSSMASVVSGNIGIARAQASQAADGRSGVLSQPLSAWFLYGPVGTDSTPTRGVGSWTEVVAISDAFRTYCPKGER